MLSEKDRELIARKGISEEKLNEEFEQFKTGFPFLKLRQQPVPVKESMCPPMRSATAT